MSGKGISVIVSMGQTNKALTINSLFHAVTFTFCNLLK